jgi:hypothetical protein
MRRRGLAAGAARAAVAVAGALLVAALVDCAGSYPEQLGVGVGGGGNAAADSTSLVQLTMTPLTATLAPGDSLQFNVLGTLGDGRTFVPIVTYRASGGIVRADGLFVAGEVAGTDSVIVTQVGGPTGNPPCCADTALVTVTAPPMAPGGVAVRHVAALGGG